MKIKIVAPALVLLLAISSLAHPQTKDKLAIGYAAVTGIMGALGSEGGENV